MMAVLTVLELRGEAAGVTATQRTETHAAAPAAIAGSKTAETAETAETAGGAASTQQLSTEEPHPFRTAALKGARQPQPSPQAALQVQEQQPKPKPKLNPKPKRLSKRDQRKLAKKNKKRQQKQQQQQQQRRDCKSNKKQTDNKSKEGGRLRYSRKRIQQQRANQEGNGKQQPITARSKGQQKGGSQPNDKKKNKQLTDSSKISEQNPAKRAKQPQANTAAVLQARNPKQHQHQHQKAKPAEGANGGENKASKEEQQPEQRQEQQPEEQQEQQSQQEQQQEEKKKKKKKDDDAGLWPPDVFRRRVRQRRRQINIGMQSEAYKQFCLAVPEKKRTAKHPRPPDPYRRVSKRAFDGLLRQWRKSLHAFVASLDTNAAATNSKNGNGQASGGGTHAARHVGTQPTHLRDSGFVSGHLPGSMRLPTTTATTTLLVNGAN